jgi:hypothetical protein
MYYINYVLEEFYKGTLSSKDQLEREIARCEKGIDDWGDVYEGDQGFQDDLNELSELKEALDLFYQYYDENCHYIGHNLNKN